MLRTKSFCLLALVGLVATAVSGQASEFDMSQIYAIDAGHSYVGFQIKYMGFAKVRGRFSGVSGTIRYDDSNPTVTSATVRVDVESLDTDHEWRDKDLMSDQWFDVEAFPAMTFSSRKAVKTAATARPTRFKRGKKRIQRRKDRAIGCRLLQRGVILQVYNAV